MKFNPFPWLCVVALLAVSFWARGHLVENSELGFACQESAQTALCKARWLSTVFMAYPGTSYLVLFLGVLATITRSDHISFLACALGVVGLVVYAKNEEAVGLGFLLGVLTLARAQLDEYRHQHRAGQHPTGDGPA